MQLRGSSDFAFSSTVFREPVVKMWTGGPRGCWGCWLLRRQGGDGADMRTVSNSMTPGDGFAGGRVAGIRWQGRDRGRGGKGNGLGLRLRVCS